MIFCVFFHVTWKKEYLMLYLCLHFTVRLFIATFHDTFVISLYLFASFILYLVFCYKTINALNLNWYIYANAIKNTRK